MVLFDGYICGADLEFFQLSFHTIAQMPTISVQATDALFRLSPSLAHIVFVISAPFFRVIFFALFFFLA